MDACTSHLLLKDRLVVAADFSSNPIDEMCRLVDELQEIGVCIKIETAGREFGFEVIDRIVNYGLDVFFDAKLSGLPSTLRNDGIALAKRDPKFVTVMSTTGKEAMSALKDTLGETLLLAVTVPTYFTHDSFKEMCGGKFSIEDAIRLFAEYAYQKGKVDGIVCSPQEIHIVREVTSLDCLIVTPNIRPLSLPVINDDQNAERSATPSEAFEMGADVIIVGRPITQAKSPRDAVMYVLDEIDSTIHRN